MKQITKIILLLIVACVLSLTAFPDENKEAKITHREPEMVLLPGGEYTMGSSEKDTTDYYPAHKVHVMRQNFTRNGLIILGDVADSILYSSVTGLELRLDILDPGIGSIIRKKAKMTEPPADNKRLLVLDLHLQEFI